MEKSTDKKEKLLKVLNIIEEGRFGGPQHRILKVAKKLKSDAITTVVVFSNYDSKPFAKALDNNEISYHSIPLHRLAKGIRHLIRFTKNFSKEVKSIQTIIRSEKPDLIHCNGSWQFKGVIAAYRENIPCTWHLNDTYMPPYVKGVFNYFYKKYQPHTIASCQRSVDFYLKNLPLSSPLQKVKHIIYPPVDTNIFHPSQNTNRHNLLNTETVNIVTVANINPVKGYETLIKAIIELNCTMSEKKIHLYCVGKRLENQKRLNAYIEQLIENNKVDNITFLGARSNVSDILRESDIYVCASKTESGPMSVFEALSTGLPVVSTDVGDLRIVFEKYKCGTIVPVDDVATMAKELQKCITDHNYRDMLSRNARQAAIQEFDLQKCAALHLEHYRTIYEKDRNTSK